MKREFFNTGGNRHYGLGVDSTSDYTDEYGNHYNDSNEYVGRTDEHGLMWDECNNYVGRIDKYGNVENETGEYIGRVDKYGRATNWCNEPIGPEENGYEYDSGSSGCFLTTACVEYNGLEDDCYELTTLRTFRDTYMVDDMESDVLKYYEIAPKIVTIIDSLSDEDKKVEYDNIYNIVKECCNLIELGDNKATYNLYKKMVEDLSSRYLVEDLVAM